MAELDKTISVIESWLKQPVLTPPPINELYNALELLKGQQGTIRKKQDDIDRLCNEIAKLKHKLHDKWTGTWEWISEDEYRCSECGNKTCVDECMEEPQYLYCPYCGSKMTFAGRN